jgi:hypothetical protein
MVDSWMAIGWAQTETDCHRLASLLLALRRGDREQARRRKANNK